MPVLDLDHARELAAAFRREGRRIVFATGAFDLLHPGHVRFLTAARAEGDALIVGVKGDRAVREACGPSRPVTPQHERAEIVAALDPVDAVVVLEDSVRDAITVLQPEVLAQGADVPDQIGGGVAVDTWGGRVVRIPIEQGWSTASIIEGIQRKTRP